MKNITVSVPDEVYRLARIRAAETGTSVSALVADYLVSLSQSREEFGRLAQQQRRIVTEIETFRASDRLDRDDLHQRAVR